jgi:tetratricopeptide (TPR) repeat protein
LKSKKKVGFLLARDTSTMSRRLRVISLLVLLAIAVTGRSQNLQPAKQDHSQEAAVIEQMWTKIAFENDGTSIREQTSRVRVQTDAGVKQWGLLIFPFQSAIQTVEIDYVRVRKPDGTTIVTPPDNVQDLDSEITRSAPFYSDLREKHVAVRGLSNGDVLEYAAHWHATKSLIPGQFWFQYTFQHNAIVLDERLEVRVPAAREVKVKGPSNTQTVSTEEGSRVYTWTFSRLQSTKDPEGEQRKETEAALGRLPPPDVQVSSFQTWEELGRWYWNLQKDRIEPSSAIRAKAAELTKGLSDDEAKLRAIYSFVSTQYRYIGVAFGIGRYQPHAADDILSNGYGDCKDKHTLLASLAQASGVTVYPVLINSIQVLDPDVPSPAQFNHIIGYVSKNSAIWLDTTPEVAPPGYLLQQLRDKQALLIAGESSIRLVNTPADPPSQSTQSFRIEGTLSNDGTFEAKIDDTTQGEQEVLLRAAFRRVAQPQWQDLVQQISYGLGYGGTVSDVSASKPEAIVEPFHFSYSYNRKDYPDWVNRQFTVPGLPFFMPPYKEDVKYPIWLGPPLETASDSRVQLPQGYKPQVPSNVDLKYDFAEYHASYFEDRGVLVADRRLLIKLHEVPAAELQDYKDFLKNMENDINRYVQTTSESASSMPSSGMPTTPFSATLPPSVRALQDLPESNSKDANQLVADARSAVMKHDMQAATFSLYRAVEADPKFTRAWLLLGGLLLQQKQVDAGIDAFHKAIESDLQQPALPKALGWSLMAISQYEQATAVWQDYIKKHPDDADGPDNLGSCLLQLKRYSEAAAAYERGLALGGDEPRREESLGSAYLLAGERDKAVAVFRKLANVDPGAGSYLNDVAYKMTNADLELPLAADYAKKATRAAEESSQQTTLQDLKTEDLQRVFTLSAYWDTLGWVEERMSNMGVAERYLQASWKLTQDGVVAGHLCHLYRRTHENTMGIKMCRMATTRMSMSHQLGASEYATELAAAQENLNYLTRVAGTSNTSKDASDFVIRERTFKLPRFLPGTESAEFFVLLASDGKSKTFKVEDVKFISGSEKMKDHAKQLKNVGFDVPAPDDVPTRFVRRGILGCYQYTGCSFVLLDPATVTSVN